MLKLCLSAQHLQTLVISLEHSSHPAEVGKRSCIPCLPSSCYRITYLGCFQHMLGVNFWSRSFALQKIWKEVVINGPDVLSESREHDQLCFAWTRQRCLPLISRALCYSLGSIPHLRRNIFHISRNNASCKVDVKCSLFSEVWMFSGQFKLSERESHNLERVLVFIVKFYLRAWTTATDAISAPAFD